MSVDQECITHYCYRLTADMPYDPEDIWQYIQDKDGYLSLGVAGDVSYYVARDHRVFFVLRYPELQRQPGCDIL